MHLDEGRIQRLMDGELDAAAAKAVMDHATQCQECSERLADARRDALVTSGALAMLDRPAPRIEAAAVAARAQAEWEPSVSMRAAGILLAIGLIGAAFAAYAAPGSPVPAWVESFAAWLGGRPAERSAAESPPTRGEAGIAVTPGPSLLVVFTTAQAAGVARVSLIDGDEVIIRAPHGAATFSSEPDRVVIHNAGSTADFTIELPRGAPRVEIRLGDQRLLLKEGARVSGVGTPAAESLLLPLSPAAP